MLDTLFFRSDFIHSPRFPKKLDIYIRYEKWTISKLSAFLNEMGDLKISNHQKTQKKIDKRKCFHFQHISIKHFYIFIKVFEDNISVQMSTEYILQNWLKEEKEFASHIGADNKFLFYPKKQMHIHFYKSYILSDSSVYFLKNYSLLYFSKYNFSQILHFFAKKFFYIGYPLNDDFSSLHKYIQYFYVQQKKKLASFSDLYDTGIKGCLILKIQLKVTKKRLPEYFYKGKNYYITGGVFIMPQSKSILFNPQLKIEGFLIDTTWRVMNFFVTSILTACISNSSLPIGFAFGNGETKDLYKFLLSSIEKETSYDFHQKVFESDQGSALKSICKTYQTTHLKCLRHLLASFKWSPYSYQTEVLVKCATSFEFQNCIQKFSDDFDKITTKNPAELKKINLTLKKIGFKFANKIIEINDPERWESVSMLCRKKYRMPSTTNCLEATHGHLNRHVPRNNKFFTSLFRIHSELNSKYINYNDRIKHNYSYLKQKTLNKYLATNRLEMEKMKVFYETNENTCLCSENRLESHIYNLDIPCRHRLSLGVQFPSINIVNINPTLQYDSLIIKEVIDETVEAPQNEADPLNFEKQYAVRQIKHFSKYQNLNKIKEYVNSKIKRYEDRDGFYIQNQEISTIQLIENGIIHFKELKQQNK